jgi:AraC-like DNA-binding protein
MKYKFENYRDRTFPIYCSTQRGGGQTVVPHYHTALELLWIREGAGELQINTEHIEVVGGEIYFIPSGCVHSFCAHSESTVISGVVFELGILDRSALPSCTESALSSLNIKDYRVEGNGLEDTLHGIAESYGETRATSRLELLSSLYRVMAILLEKYGGEEEATEYDRIAPVVEYMQKNYQRRITLNQLGKLVHVCEDHLIRLFKARWHRTPARYLLELRIECAMKLLSEGELSVSEVAARSGFSSVNYMSRVFREAVNMTPSEYKRTAGRRHSPDSARDVSER